MGRRIRWLGMVLVVCFAAVIAQLVNIQMRQASALDKSSTNPRNAIAQLNNFRGTILAGDGTTVLAQSEPVPKPKPGAKKYYRTYPGGSLYSGIVGYDSPYYGTSEVENVYNTYLSLHSQPAKTLGQLLSPPPPTTDNVTLTIQPTLQQTAAAALQQTIRSGNHDGAIVVMNPKTGAILAMYSNPSFDPNAISVPTVAADETAYKADTTPDAEGFAPIEPMATFDRFPPGSTYKIVTTSAVYNLKPTLAGFTWGPGKCTKPGTIPGTTHVICNDSTSVSGASVCGGNIRTMLPASCDPGYVMLGLRVGATAMYQQSKDFGVDSVPPIDLTTVSKSHFPTANQFTTGPTHVGQPGLALVSFGQGTVALTALQNAMNAATVANTGAQMTPHVMSQIRSSQGALVKKYKPTVHKQVMSAAAAQQVKQLMGLVVTTKYGTAAGVGFPRTEQVGVKTGTAQVTTTTKLIDDWMIGIAPITDPTVAVAVVVPRQPFNTYGATTAGPIVKRMITATLAEEKAHGLVPATSTTQAPPPPTPLTTTTTSTTTTTTTTVPGATTTTTTAPPATTTTTGATTTTTTAAPSSTAAALGPITTTPPPGKARPPSRSGASS